MKDVVGSTHPSRPSDSPGVGTRLSSLNETGRKGTLVSGGFDPLVGLSSPRTFAE